ncbi:hypothetical protein P175DRAFT_0555208 [Aspergillus ochraceoroseus IBT 24754]|uniref:Uncharacterized protein n=1 Tax=Aspergillus ochraceoroseus IBT 24754 TaxID=1392256 RepID=A0A2T5M1X5_9EURO|nr:uncharacterized protein P175DRAFT_0555208 [Aspergillus ochraceoroseus IBT 24754]PTU22537.1 hypothetical protein P175DRAFT_0555208 [Aspergillus ochraceoroseus IBT 24754]
MNNRRRLLIFQESPNPSNPTEPIYHAVNKLGLPICGAGPDMPSILDLPLRILRAFTEIFNDPRYKGWAIVSAAPYKDPTVSGTFFAVVLEQVQGQVQGQGQGCRREYDLI